jgi:hypothetical protein
MILSCVVPMLLIFILPVLRVNGSATFVIFIVLMFVCHFLILGHRDGDSDQNTKHHLAEPSAACRVAHQIASCQRDAVVSHHDNS